MSKKEFYQEENTMDEKKEIEQIKIEMVEVMMAYADGDKSISRPMALMAARVFSKLSDVNDPPPKIASRFLRRGA